MDNESDSFQHHRGRLFGIAYRMLGSRTDAEDVVQDAWVRWHSVDRTVVRSAEAWLTTTVSRLSIDRLRRVKLEREHYPGPWLPEPLAASDMQTPELQAELDSDVSIAFLALLEALSVEERAAFVLHDILDDDYIDVAEAIGKSQAACRQLVHRARTQLSLRRRRFIVDDATRTAMLERFIAAANRGDRQEIVALFAEDSVMTSDGGGKAVAVSRLLLGAQRISWLWFAVARRLGAGAQRRLIRVNGEPAIANYFDGQLHSVSTIETDGERIHAYFSIANPDKLTAFM